MNTSASQSMEARRAARDQTARTVDATTEASSSLTPELVIALCGPIGSPLHETADQIDNALREFGYQTEKLRLSHLIRINAPSVGMAIDNSSRFAEIKSLILAGDELRNRYGNDVLAKIAIAKISADRRKQYGEPKDRASESEVPAEKRITAQRVCHIIDSIKNTSELELLRLIYGEALFAIGVFSPLEIRQENLQRAGSLTGAQISELIDTDSGEEFDHGQSVRNTFPKCDFFLRVDHSIAGPSEAADKAVAQVLTKVRRFFNLIFRVAVVTPSVEETAMYASASAARNSACISRQVGAAVTSKAGEVLAVGWNDVPRSGGGLYGKPQLDASNTELVDLDKRCFALTGAKCFNDEEKEAVATKVVEALVANKLLPRDSIAAATKTILKDSRVKDLIEFSRAVHAEMHAILAAGRVAGERIVGGKIFVTTYPCHSCARHIVAAGISEIHFIEPYRKSLATRLHKDELSESVDAAPKVRLLQFDGVAPRRFIDLFEAGERKVSGVLSLRPRQNAIPSTLVSMKAIPRLEEVVVADVTSKNLKLLSLIDAGGTNDGKESPTSTPPAA